MYVCVMQKAKSDHNHNSNRRFLFKKREIESDQKLNRNQSETNQKLMRLIICTYNRRSTTFFINQKFRNLFKTVSKTFANLSKTHSKHIHFFFGKNECYHQISQPNIWLADKFQLFTLTFC